MNQTTQKLPLASPHFTGFQCRIQVRGKVSKRVQKVPGCCLPGCHPGTLSSLMEVVPMEAFTILIRAVRHQSPQQIWVIRLRINAPSMYSSLMMRFRTAGHLRIEKPAVVHPRVPATVHPGTPATNPSSSTFRYCILEIINNLIICSVRAVRNGSRGGLVAVDSGVRIGCAWVRFFF